MTLYTERKGEGSEARSRTTEAVRKVERTCDARRKSACRLLARRRLHVLVFKTLRFSSRNLFHAIACENACASSPATTFHLFLIENRWASFPVLQRLLAPQRSTHPLSKTHRTSQNESASHFRTSGLARLLPARAASENLSTSKVKIKYFLMRAQKNFKKIFASYPLNENSRSDRSNRSDRSTFLNRSSRSLQNDPNEPNGSNDPNELDWVCENNKYFDVLPKER